MTDGRVITVFGSAGKRDVRKRSQMAQISAQHADLTVLTAEDPRTDSLSDILQVMADGSVSSDLAKIALDKLEIDPLGLDRIDRRILEVIVDKFSGGPVGLNSVSAATAEEMETIEDIYEPFLLRLGFIQRTPRGRIVTEAGYKHLGMNPPGDLQNKLV